MSNEAFVPRRPHFPNTPNHETYFGHHIARLPSQFDARKFFIHHYEPIRRTLDHHQQLGLALLVFADRPEPVAASWVEARLDRSTSLILGRHTSCTVSVPSSAQEVSLRHAAVCVRAISLHSLRARFFDLRTQFGFSDETGRDLRGVTIDGTSFFRFGELFVVALVTGEDPSTYANATEAYDAIPPRVFVDAQDVAPTDRRVRLVHPSNDDGVGDECTFVRSQLGVMVPEVDLLAADEQPEGELQLTTSRGTSLVRAVGRAALSRGVLFGRYQRCDAGRQRASHELSRVHLLLVRDKGELLAIDTASSNGTFFREKQFRQLRVESEMALDLAGELTVRWVGAPL